MTAPDQSPEQAVPSELPATLATVPAVPVGSPFRRGFLATLSYAKAPFGPGVLKPLMLDTPERRNAGLIVVLPGIEGISSLNHSLAWGLADAGLPHAIRLHDWTLRTKPAFVNLWMKGRTLRAAAYVAEILADYRAEFPGRPVHLVGHSGGGALIPHVLQELPGSTKIDTGIMIGPAISPRYDLAPALSRVNNRLVNVCSWLDWYFLGIGTTLAGTLDRRYGRSAGNCGFRLPPSADSRRELYQQKLLEIRFHWSMLRHWHYGGHFSCVNRVFVEHHLAPLLKPPVALNE